MPEMPSAPNSVPVRILFASFLVVIFVAFLASFNLSNLKTSADINDADLNVNVISPTATQSVTPTPTPTSTTSVASQIGGQPGYDPALETPQIAIQPTTAQPTTTPKASPSRTPVSVSQSPLSVSPITVSTSSKPKVTTIIAPGEIIQVPLINNIQDLNSVELTAVNGDIVAGITVYQVTDNTINLSGRAIPNAYIGIMIEPDGLNFTTLSDNNGFWHLSFANTLVPNKEHEVLTFATEPVARMIIGKRLLIKLVTIPSAVYVSEGFVAQHPILTIILSMIAAWPLSLVWRFLRRFLAPVY